MHAGKRRRQCRAGALPRPRDPAPIPEPSANRLAPVALPRNFVRGLVGAFVLGALLVVASALHSRFERRARLAEQLRVVDAAIQRGDATAAEHALYNIQYTDDEGVSEAAKRISQLREAQLKRP